MSQKQKDERVRRRAQCEQAGAVRLLSIRSGVASQSEIDEMRGAVLRGDCPLCGESGFKSIAGHCQTMHGVLSRELRDLLELTYTESICSPDTSAKMREHGLGKNPSLLGKPTSRTVSKKGRAVSLSNLASWPTWRSKDALVESGRKVGLSRKGMVPWNKTTAHGTVAMFRQGCRCNLCDAANKTYWRQINQRRGKPSNVKVRGCAPGESEKE